MRLDLYAQSKHIKNEDLLGAIGLTDEMIPRSLGWGIEDCKIIIHTRTGGGNRKWYDNLESCKANYPEYFKGGQNYEDSLKRHQNGESYPFEGGGPIPHPTEPSGPWNDDLRANQYYISDEDDDDDFDGTCANFWFRIPDELKAKIDN